MNDQMLNELKALHTPSRGDFNWWRPVCGGDDFDGWESEPPEWPCQSALILWPTVEERATVLAEWKAWADPAREAYLADHNRTRFNLAEPVRTAYEERLKAQMDAANYLSGVRGAANSGTVTFEIVRSMPELHTE